MHQGQIIEHAVRKNGYNISDLARGLDINRRSVYNYFASPRLKPNLILQIGSILRHDFRKDFPELYTQENEQLHAPKVAKSPVVIIDEELEYKEKYISLLEKYNELLKEAHAMAESE